MELHNRFLSLDVFRGMTVCFMIVVNTPGSWSHVYAPLAHASWHGFTPTDFVFPAFLFAVGNAMAFTMPKFFTQAQRIFWVKIIKRTILIFSIGFLLYWFPFIEDTGHGWKISPLSHTRILGVLQRIALCYFLAAVIVRFIPTKLLIAVSGVILLVYWFLLYHFDTCPERYCLEGNAALRLDLYVLGANHLYAGEGIPFDPEGLLSTLPAIVNVLGGYLVGKLIREKGSSFESITVLTVFGGLLVLGALAWDMVFPINKKLWTSSFVLLTNGISVYMLAFLMYGLELRKIVKGAYFFQVFGRNPLFIYVLSSLLVSVFAMPVGEKTLNVFFYENILNSFLSPKSASLLFALTYMFLCWLVGWVLDRKSIYIKV